MLLLEPLYQPPSVFPGCLESDVVTVGADSSCLFGEQARACFPSAQANSLQEPSELAVPVLSSVTGAVQALAHQSALLTAKPSSVLLGKFDVHSARRHSTEVRSPYVYHQVHGLLLVDGRCL